MQAEATTKQGVRAMTIGSLVGMLSLLAYLFMGARNETLEVQKLLTTKVEQFATVQAELDSLSSVLDRQLAQVRRLGGSVTDLERIRQQLETDKRRLKYDLTFSERQYDLKIRDYRNFLVQQEGDVAKLQAENGSLRNRTRSLEQEKRAMLTENEGLKYERAALAKTVIDYSAQNADLKRKVTVASAIKAVSVTITTLSANGRERHEEPYKASRIDRLKIAFIIPSNPVARPGSTGDIYVRILDPNGAVVGESGSAGVLRFDGRELGFSTRQEVTITPDDQPVAILFHRDAPYRAGTHTVELYTDGSQIGTAQFNVR